MVCLSRIHDGPMDLSSSRGCYCWPRGVVTPYVQPGQPSVQLATEKWSSWLHFRLSWVKVSFQFLTKTLSVVGLWTHPILPPCYGCLSLLFCCTLHRWHVPIATVIWSWIWLMENLLYMYHPHKFNVFFWWPWCVYVPICSKRILNQAQRLRCWACCVQSHMKYITLAPDE